MVAIAKQNGCYSNTTWLLHWFLYQHNMVAIVTHHGCYSNLTWLLKQHNMVAIFVNFALNVYSRVSREVVSEPGIRHTLPNIQYKVQGDGGGGVKLNVNHFAREGASARRPRWHT